MVHIFIVNPFSGKKNFANGLRERLARISNLEYFVFTTRYRGYEKEIVRLTQDAFRGQEIRYYCCGGSGTMANMMNGFDDLSKVEIAWYPCGATNDFLKMFGSDYERFRSVEELINGEILQVDYISANDEMGLKSVSVGLDTYVTQKRNDYQLIGMLNEEVNHTIAILQGILLNHSDEYEVIVNNDVYTGTITELFFGNGNVMDGNLLFNRSADATDGVGEYCITSATGIKAVKYLLALQAGDVEAVKENSLFGKTSFLRVRKKDGTAFSVNIDGEITTEQEEWFIRIVEKGLNLVVPKGAKLEATREVSRIAGREND